MAHINAGFMQNVKGEIAIFLDDPGFVRAETIILDKADNSLHAVLFEGAHCLGTISASMAHGLRHGDEVTLYARPTENDVVDMRARLSVHIQ